MGWFLFGLLIGGSGEQTKPSTETLKTAPIRYFTTRSVGYKDSQARQDFLVNRLKKQQDSESEEINNE